MQSEHDETIARLREAIRAVDLAIVEAVNRRLELVAEIRAYKERIGATFVDRDQERRNLEALKQANGGPLPEDALERLYAEILALGKGGAH
jgi:chorismate mutase